LYLTNEEEKMLAGEFGPVLERSFRLLVRLGEIYGAEKMIPVGSVQVAGVSYKSIGDPGLEFLEDFANQGAKVRVLTTLNPAGMDLECWEELGFPKEFAKKQIKIIEAFRSMGLVVSATCTPYLAGNLPRFREHIAWSESSAVSFANSVIGARTNREGGPSALAAALCGITPNYGLHLDENRKPEIIIELDNNLKLLKASDFGALGYFVGKAVKNKIPYFKSMDGTTANTNNLKALGAAMAASGAVALYYIRDLTPEANDMPIDQLETVQVDRTSLQETYDKLTTGDELDIVIVGCPHCSIGEIESITRIVEGKNLKKPLWVCTSQAVKHISNSMGFTKIIEDAGGKVITDTCMVVAPIKQMGYNVTGVNSGKAANYLPGFCKQNVIFSDIEGLIAKLV
jgi:predicted aconitase